MSRDVISTNVTLEICHKAIVVTFNNSTVFFMRFDINNVIISHV